MPHVGPKWNIYLFHYCAKFELSFNFCARLGFNVIWFVKYMKIRKLKIEIINIYNTIHSMTQSTAEFLHYVIQGVLKLFLALNLLLTHLLNFFIVTK